MPRSVKAILSLSAFGELSPIILLKRCKKSVRHRQTKYKLVLFFYLCSLLLLSGCRPTVTDKKQVLTNTTNLIKYAHRFSIVKLNQGYKVAVLGNRYTQDTTSVFIISEDTAGLHKYNNHAIIIKSPCQKIAALSSIYAAMFYELGNLNELVAIDNIDYITNAAILQKHKNGALKELAKSPKTDIEQTVALHPDIIFMFGMGQGRSDTDIKLEQTKIPLAISVDHLEEHPLARAEWLKFFAVFTGKLAKADSIFIALEKNYDYLKTLTDSLKQRPSVFSETKYSEFWYMPGGKSFMAQLIRDAGAKYLWADNTDFGSLPLSFEQVYARAKDADFWLNPSSMKTLKELELSEKRYTTFKAHQTKQVYNNTLHVNELGYSNYWETGMIYPNRILSDLILIFHPELKPQVKNDLYYYEQLK